MHMQMVPDRRFKSRITWTVNLHDLFIFSEVIYYPKQYLQFVVRGQQTMNEVVSGTVTVDPSLGHIRASSHSAAGSF